MNTNFIELIKKFTIIIPLIQRDYAQGRIEEKLKAENFLDAIHHGLKKGLNLDFIYGKVDKDKQTFIPLDGQQRLTTLFLIHWYVSLGGSHISNLTKFDYQVRTSTKDFIKELTKKDNWMKLSKTDIKQSLENSNWFFLSWKNDPSVVALLNMLNLIEIKFKETHLDELEKITFEFLDLDEFKLTDELYVKMNARGKPLTNFENFKAKFENLLPDIKDRAKLDNEWLDIFWYIAKNKTESIEKAPKIADVMFFSFFENITLFFELNIIKSIDEFKLFDFLTRYDDEQIEIIKSVLNSLINYQDSEMYILREVDIFKNFLKPYIKGGMSGISYEDRARFYSLMKFFLLKKSINESNIKILRNWMRVNLNLINNVIFNDINDFKNIIKIIDELSVYLEDIYSGIFQINLQRKSEQFEEELIKAKLITQDSNWENEFIEAEKHWYLDGQIGFLIDYSEKDLYKFKKYRDQFFALFDETKLLNDKYKTLIHRALLTYGNYLPKHSNSDKYTFCFYDNTLLRVKNENWRQVFKSQDGYFKSLLDILDYKNIDVEISLQESISNYVFNCDDWMSYIINPCNDFEVISSARYYQIKITNEHDIYLNQGDTKVTSWGWSRVSDLYSYYLYIKDFKDQNIEPFNNISYRNSSSPKDEKPCIVIELLMYKDTYQFEIVIWQDDGNFILEIFNRKNNIFLNNLEKILVEENFVKQNDNYYYVDSIPLCKLDNVREVINNLSQKLKSI